MVYAFQATNSSFHAAVQIKFLLEMTFFKSAAVALLVALALVGESAARVLLATPASGSALSL
jgi:hypothetical protein